MLSTTWLNTSSSPINVYARYFAAAVDNRNSVRKPVFVGAGQTVVINDLLTSLGFVQTLVHMRPRVALLSTGDEVAEPGTVRKPGQIYDSNRFTLRGSIARCGGDVIDLGIVPDRREELRARLLDAASMAEIVVSSGGVSVGVYDLVKDVLEEIGGIEFWQVAMQPGRPLAMGSIGPAHFFGLPGTGRRIEFRACRLFRMEGELIEHERRIYDFTGLLVQVGVLRAKPAKP